MNQEIVDVYWNSRSRTFSVRQNGRVRSRMAQIILRNPRFLVNKAARDRVRRTGHKTVHAVVRGEQVIGTESLQGAIPVTYNPQTCDTFVRVFDRTPIEEGRLAILETDGTRPSVWVLA